MIIKLDILIFFWREEFYGKYLDVSRLDWVRIRDAYDGEESNFVGDDFSPLTLAFLIVGDQRVAVVDNLHIFSEMLPPKDAQKALRLLIAYINEHPGKFMQRITDK